MNLTALVIAATLTQTPAAPSPIDPTGEPRAAPAVHQGPPATALPAAELPTQKAAASRLKPPQLYGFIDAQVSSTDAPSPTRDVSTFELRRARIGARGKITPNVGYNLMFDGADTSLKDAYGVIDGMRFAPGVELRFGQWKTPFGYEQQESDTRLLWVNSSFVVQALARSTSTATLTANPDSRDLGAGVLGKWSLGALGAEVAASVVNGAGPNRRDDLNTKNGWGRAGVVYKASLATVRAGGSFGVGRQLSAFGANSRFDGVGTPIDDTQVAFETYGGDVTVDTPYFFAATEIIQSERHQAAFASGAEATRSSFTARGWYAGVYGKTPWSAGPIFRAEQFDRNRSAANNTNERYTVGAYVDVLPVNGRLILNYEIDQSDRPVRTGNRAILFGQVMF